MPGGAEGGLAFLRGQGFDPVGEVVNFLAETAALPPGP
jgi:hypothetical protein